MEKITYVVCGRQEGRTSQRSRKDGKRISTMREKRQLRIK
jgi:hypothetical protein